MHLHFITYAILSTVFVCVCVCRWELWHIQWPLAALFMPFVCEYVLKIVPFDFNLKEFHSEKKDHWSWAWCCVCVRMLIFTLELNSFWGAFFLHNAHNFCNQISRSHFKTVQIKCKRQAMHVSAFMPMCVFCALFWIHLNVILENAVHENWCSHLYVVCMRQIFVDANTNWLYKSEISKHLLIHTLSLSLAVSIYLFNSFICIITLNQCFITQTRWKKKWIRNVIVTACT